MKKETEALLDVYKQSYQNQVSIRNIRTWSMFLSFAAIQNSLENPSDNEFLVIADASYSIYTNSKHSLDVFYIAYSLAENYRKGLVNIEDIKRMTYEEFVEMNRLEGNA